MASSLETNKALAALLTAGIIASGSGVISRIIYHPSMPEENAYVIEVPEGEAAGGEGAAEAEATPLPVLLAAASPEEGAGEAKKCAACHSFEQGGAAKIGPPLWGVVGRDIASVAGFAYSDALLEQEGTWTFDALNDFVSNPKGFAPGTKMAFAGIKDPEDRADVLVYLRSLAENPVPLPEAPAAAAGERAGEPRRCGRGWRRPGRRPSPAPRPPLPRASPRLQQAKSRWRPSRPTAEAAPESAAAAGRWHRRAARPRRRRRGCQERQGLRRVPQLRGGRRRQDRAAAVGRGRARHRFPGRLLLFERPRRQGGRVELSGAR